MAEKEYIEATVTVHPRLLDALTNYITENISDGVELEDTGNANLISIKFYVHKSCDDFRPALKEYLSQINEQNDKLVFNERTVFSEDWELAYKQSIAPVFVGDEIVIRPPWVELNQNFKYDIIIEPKMAFGTGHHETTQACLRLIRKYFKTSQRLLDFGCGSGVLAILAGKMGAGYLKAIDIDPIAVENTRENFEINEIDCKFDIIRGSFDEITNDLVYHMVCANLNKKDLVTNIHNLLGRTSDNGMLLLSGLLETDKSEIENAIDEFNLQITESIHEGEWLTCCVNR